MLLRQVGALRPQHSRDKRLRSAPNLKDVCLNTNHDWPGNARALQNHAEYRSPTNIQRILPQLPALRAYPPACKPYPPACKPYGLEAGLEAGPEAGPGSSLNPLSTISRLRPGSGYNHFLYHCKNFL